MSDSRNPPHRRESALRGPEASPFGDPYPGPDSPGEFAKRAVEEFFRQYDSAKAREGATSSENERPLI